MIAGIDKYTVRSMLRGALLLVIAAFAGGGLVVTVHEATAERIKANERLALLRNIDALVPPDSRDNDPLQDSIQVLEPNLLGSDTPLTVYRARRENQPVAAILEAVAPDGYSGDIRLLIAIFSNGQLAGVRVLKHRETPGLGDKIEIEKSRWVLDFNGKSLTDPRKSRWKVRKDGGDFDQFTGATITPRAIVGAVARTLEFFEQDRDELLAPLPTPKEPQEPQEPQEPEHE